MRNHDISDLRFRTLLDRKQADGNTLCDQTGHPVLYESLVNRAVFDHVLTHGLYHLTGQRALSTHPLYMPVGLHWNKLPEGGQLQERDPARQGSITIKLAWKVLGACDHKQRFYTQNILVADEVGGVRSMLAGLVGMHVAHKTQSCASWVWSTFEHVDALGHDDEITGYKGQPLFRVQRIVPVDDSTEIVNRRFRSLLKELGSPWCHYRLVGTQRMARTPHYREGVPSPQHLSNPVFETFVPLERASAISAHQLAALAASPDGQTAAAADFMFLLRGVTRPWARVAEIPADQIGVGTLERSIALPRVLSASLTQHNLQTSPKARLEWLVPSLEWLVIDEAETLVLRREGESTLAVYRDGLSTLEPEVEDYQAFGDDLAKRHLGLKENEAVPSGASPAGLVRSS